MEASDNLHQSGQDKEVLVIGAGVSTGATDSQLLGLVLLLGCGPTGQSSKCVRVGNNQRALLKAWCCLQQKPAEHWLRTLQLCGAAHAIWAKGLRAICEATKGGSTWSLPESEGSLCPH